MDYKDFIERELKKAADLAQSYFGKVSHTVKAGDNNQVLTEADTAVGKQLVDAVQTEYPDHNIIDEEAGIVDKSSQFTWVIDPIDGTSNFAVGLPEYGIMIGLLEDDKPIAGGVIIPEHDKLYSAEKDKGATCNGEPIHVTNETNLDNVLLAYGIDSHLDQPDYTVRECRMLADIVSAVRNIRSSGSDAIDPMYVADGRYGARVNLSSKIWDNVAPHIITEEAGARWTAHDGSPADYTNPLAKAEQNYTFCVASPVLHEQLQKVMKTHLV